MFNKEQTIFLSALKDTEIDIKIPYRYKRFECDFKDCDDSYITSQSICKGDILKTELELSTLWKENGFSGMVWRTKKIKKEMN